MFASSSKNSASKLCSNHIVQSLLPDTLKGFNSYVIVGGSSMSSKNKALWGPNSDMGIVPQFLFKLFAARNMIEFANDEVSLESIIESMNMEPTPSTPLPSRRYLKKESIPKSPNVITTPDPFKSLPSTAQHCTISMSFSEILFNHATDLIGAAFADSSLLSKSSFSGSSSTNTIAILRNIQEAGAVGEAVQEQKAKLSSNTLSATLRKLLSVNVVRVSFSHDLSWGSGGVGEVVFIEMPAVDGVASLLDAFPAAPLPDYAGRELRILQSFADNMASMTPESKLSLLESSPVTSQLVGALIPENNISPRVHVITCLPVVCSPSIMSQTLRFADVCASFSFLSLPTANISTSAMIDILSSECETITTQVTDVLSNVSQISLSETASLMQRLCERQAILSQFKYKCFPRLSPSLSSFTSLPLINGSRVMLVGPHGSPSLRTGNETAVVEAAAFDISFLAAPRLISLAANPSLHDRVSLVCSNSHLLVGSSSKLEKSSGNFKKIDEKGLAPLHCLISRSAPLSSHIQTIIRQVDAFNNMEKNSMIEGCEIFNNDVEQQHLVISSLLDSISKSGAIPSSGSGNSGFKDSALQKEPLLEIAIQSLKRHFISPLLSNGITSQQEQPANHTSSNSTVSLSRPKLVTTGSSGPNSPNRVGSGLNNGNNTSNPNNSVSPSSVKGKLSLTSQLLDGLPHKLFLTVLSGSTDSSQSNLAILYNGNNNNNNNNTNDVHLSNANGSGIDLISGLPIAGSLSENSLATANTDETSVLPSLMFESKIIINGLPINKNATVELKHGDIITVGVNNTYMVCFPLRYCFDKQSTLSRNIENDFDGLNNAYAKSQIEKASIIAQSAAQALGKAVPPVKLGGRSGYRNSISQPMPLSPTALRSMNSLMSPREGMLTWRSGEANDNGAIGGSQLANTLLTGFVNNNNANVDIIDEDQEADFDQGKLDIWAMLMRKTEDHSLTRAEKLISEANFQSQTSQKLFGDVHSSSINKSRYKIGLCYDGGSALPCVIREDNEVNAECHSVGSMEKIVALMKIFNASAVDPLLHHQADAPIPSNAANGINQLNGSLSIQQATQQVAKFPPSLPSSPVNPFPDDGDVESSGFLSNFNSTTIIKNEGQGGQNSPNASIMKAFKLMPPQAQMLNPWAHLDLASIWRRLVLCDSLEVQISTFNLKQIDDSKCISELKRNLTKLQYESDFSTERAIKAEDAAAFARQSLSALKEKNNETHVVKDVYDQLKAKYDAMNDSKDREGASLRNQCSALQTQMSVLQNSLAKKDAQMQELAESSNKRIEDLTKLHKDAIDSLSLEQTNTRGAISDTLRQELMAIGSRMDSAEQTNNTLKLQLEVSEAKSHAMEIKHAHQLADARKAASAAMTELDDLRQTCSMLQRKLETAQISVAAAEEDQRLLTRSKKELTIARSEFRSLESKCRLAFPRLIELHDYCIELERRLRMEKRLRTDFDSVVYRELARMYTTHGPSSVGLRSDAAFGGGEGGGRQRSLCPRANRSLGLTGAVDQIDIVTKSGVKSLLWPPALSGGGTDAARRSMSRWDDRHHLTPSTANSNKYFKQRTLFSERDQPDGTDEAIAAQERAVVLAQDSMLVGLKRPPSSASAKPQEISFLNAKQKSAGQKRPLSAAASLRIMQPWNLGDEQGTSIEKLIAHNSVLKIDRELSTPPQLSTSHASDFTPLGTAAVSHHSLLNNALSSSLIERPVVNPLSSSTLVASLHIPIASQHDPKLSHFSSSGRTLDRDNEDDLEEENAVGHPLLVGTSDTPVDEDALNHAASVRSKFEHAPLDNLFDEILTRTTEADRLDLPAGQSVQKIKKKRQQSLQLSNGDGFAPMSPNKNIKSAQPDPRLVVNEPDSYLKQLLRSTVDARGRTVLLSIMSEAEDSIKRPVTTGVDSPSNIRNTDVHTSSSQKHHHSPGEKEETGRIGLLLSTTKSAEKFYEEDPHAFMHNHITSRPSSAQAANGKQQLMAVYLPAELKAKAYTKSKKINKNNE